MPWRNQCGFIPFDFRKVEIAPRRGVLAPPHDTLVIFQQQIIASIVVIHNKEVFNDCLAAVLQKENQVIAATLEVLYLFRGQLQANNRWLVQGKVLCLYLTNFTCFLANDLHGRLLSLIRYEDVLLQRPALRCSCNKTYKTLVAEKKGYSKFSSHSTATNSCT